MSPDNVPPDPGSPMHTPLAHIGDMVFVSVNGHAELVPDTSWGRIHWPTFWATDHNATDWLVEPVIAKGRNHSLTATAKVGKSLLGLHIAAGAASGGKVFGREVDPITVVYLDEEMVAADLQERLEDMGYGPEDDLERLRYHQLSEIRPINTIEGAGDLLNLVHDPRDGWPDLLIIDTLARVITGEENERSPYLDLYRLALSPLKAHGVAVLRIDHAGHENKRARGSSAKSGDVDIAWFVEAAENGLTLTATHRRLGWVPEKVNVARYDEPLRFVVTDDLWPAGVVEVARMLDRLEIPLEWGRTRIRRVLREKGEKVRNQTLQAALRYRQNLSRSGASELPAGDTSGTDEEEEW